MQEKIEFIKQTIELNRDILEDSKEDTNDLVIIDLLNALGYDRRHKRNLTRVRDEDFDWEIHIEDKYIPVAVKKLGDNLDYTSKLLESSFDNSVIAVLETNGYEVSLISSYNYKEIIRYDLRNCNDEESEKLAKLTSDNIVNAIEEFNKNSAKNKIKDAIFNRNESVLNGELLKEFGAEYIFSELEEVFITASDKDLIIPEGMELVPSVELEILRSENENAGEIPEGMELVESEELENLRNIANNPVIPEGYELILIDDANELRNKVNSIDDFKNNIAKLEAELSEAMNNNSADKLVELEAANNTIKELEDKLTDANEQLIRTREQINNYSEEVAKLNNDIKEANELVESLQTQLTEVQTKEETKQSSGDNHKSLVEQVQELTLELSQKQSIIEDKDAEIERLKNTIDSSENPLVTQSKELLDAIEDDEEGQRGYVAVVNGNLYQTQTIEKFVGTSLQELYAIVTFELMPYLFDGDIFTITDKATRKDFMIGNKAYDLILGDLNEEECINRLKTIFNKFPAVVFLSKTVGKYENKVVEFSDASEDYEVTEETKDLIGEDADKFESDALGNFEAEPMEDFEVSFGDENSDEDIGFGGLDVENDAIDFTESTDDITSDTTSDIGGYEYDGCDNQNNLGCYHGSALCFAVCDLSNVLWNDKLSIGAPRYIYYNDRTYIISGESVEEQLKELIFAILSYSDNKIDLMRGMKDINFSSVSTYVNTSHDGVRIPLTKYYIDAYEFGKILPIIDKICKVADIDTSNLYIYFEGTTQYDAFVDNIVDTSDFVFENVPVELDSANNYSDQHCIIAGTSLPILNSDEYSIGYLRNIVKALPAVKTKYMSVTLREQSDIEYALTEILINYDGEFNELADKLGNCPGTANRLMSNDAEDMGGDYYTIQINGNDYYVTKMEPWQLVYALIKMHSISVGDDLISLRVVLNKEILQMYQTDYISYNPVESLVAQSLTEYISDRLK